MPPAKRQPSKQKRTSQNRQQRAALQARKAAASTATGGAGSGSDAGGGRRPGVLGRMLGGGGPTGGAGAAAAGGTPRSTGGLFGAPAGDQPPGHRAALMGVLAALVAAGVTLFSPVRVDGDGDFYTAESKVAEWADSAARVATEEPDLPARDLPEQVDEWLPDSSEELNVVAGFPTSLLVLFAPLGAVLAFRAVRARRPARVVNRNFYLTLLGALLAGAAALVFLPAAIAVGVAGFQVRRAEMAAVAAAAAASGAGGPADGDVIDAQVVEEDPSDRAEGPEPSGLRDADADAEADGDDELR